MQHVLMITPLSSQPRIIKRAIHLNKFVDLEVLGFRRRIYEQNKFPDNINFSSLGYIDNAKYVKRIFKIPMAVLEIRKRVRRDTTFYAMSIDCLLLAWLSGIKTGFYEVGDLRSCENPGSIFARMERFFIRRLKGVIITSKFFYSDYFANYPELNGEKFFLIENKLDQTVLNSPRKLQISDSEVKVKIGLIGLLRYEKPIRWLINFVNNHSSDYELHCFGDGPFKSIVEESVNKNIYYHGSYKAHEQLEMIYKSIDLNFVVYDSNSKNVQLAIPNKLYESIYFCKPILVAKDTCLEKEVLNLKVGASVSLACEVEFARDLRDVCKAKRMLFSNHSNNIDVSYLIDDSQNKLREIFKK